MSFRYLTFDCYGTLIDWRKGIERSLVEAFGVLPVSGGPLIDAYVEAEKTEEGSYKRYREVLRRSALRVAGGFGVRAEASAVERFASSVPSWPAFPDAAKTLRALGAEGYRRYILSNVDTDLLQGTIRSWDLEVDGFVTAEEVGSYKPDFGHWERFLGMTGSRKDEVLHVAQSVYHDIVPTTSLGIASAWVNRYREPIPVDVEPLYVCEGLADLLQILE